MESNTDRKSQAPTRCNLPKSSRNLWRSLNLTKLGYLLIGFWAISGGLTTGVNLGIVQRMERQAQVLFFRLRGQVAPPEDILILEIDQDSLAQGEFYQAEPERYPELEPIQAWPWQRTAYAQVIDKLLTAGAKSVSVDVIFDLASSYGKADDQQLQQVLQRYREQIILATSFESFGTEEVQQAQLISPNPIFQAAPKTLGLVNFPIDLDGRIYELANDYDQEVLRPLGLAQEEIPSFAEATLRAAKINSPPSPGRNIFFYGPPGTFKQVSFWHVLDPNNWEVHLKNQTFKDKMVLIGATADSLQDLKRTPFSDTLPGIELHANAIATLMEGRAIAQAFPNNLLRGLLVFLGVAGTGIFLSNFLKRLVAQLLGALGIAVAWGAVGYLSFTYGGIILPTAVPVVAIALTGISCLATGAIRIQLERLRLYRTLGRYVAAPIVNEILTQHADDFQALLKGRKLRATILFSDIRGFTTLSLKLEPEQLVEQLNTYLNAMVEAILAEGGTLDKFIGDAVMAEFGSPISYGEKNDAIRAIRAALGMRRALVELQAQWQEQGQELFFNGIGINFGELIAGDIGSYRRREYAVIGDAVNVASRVEGLTGKLGTDILITESLYQLVQDEVEVVPMGEYQLKGRQENLVKLYSLIGLKGEDPTLYQQVQTSLHQYLGITKK
ncbi:MAG: adenylate/guanylate cyclase domain-containing protein [Symploca sp. SIO1A3]|nr:adenylate/guanylate cyclase domain-containing protein [Symploca sp. SIO1A3]